MSKKDRGRMVFHPDDPNDGRIEHSCDKHGPVIYWLAVEGGKDSSCPLCEANRKFDAETPPDF